jgi:hypothetical protein
VNLPAVTGIHQEQSNQLTRALTPQQLMEIGKELIEQFLKRVVLALSGVFIPGSPAFDQLKDWAESIPILGDIVHIVEEVLKTAPLAAKNIIGSILHLLTQIPIGGVTNVQPNLLSAPTFATGDISDNSIWSTDTGKTHSADGSGSAKVTANGVMKALRSGSGAQDAIAVSAGQVVTAAIWVSHTGYTGSGAAVLLQAVPFTGTVAEEPVTLASYTPTSANSDWVQITGLPSVDPQNPGPVVTPYTVPDGVTGLQLRLVVTDSALTGTFWFDDATVKQSGKIQQSWVQGLPESLQGLNSLVQLLIDTVHNAITGVTTTFHTLEELAMAIANLPFTIVGGLGGPGDIGATIQAFLDHLVGGLVGTPGTGAGFADVFNISKLISSMASQGANAWQILGIRNNKPVNTGLLPSSTSNFDITAINTTLSTAPVKSLIGVIRVAESSPLGVVSWLGCGTSGLTAFYVNIWKCDPTTGNWSLVHHSPNIVGRLVAGTTPGWNFYELATPLAVVAGEDYAYELVPVGGSHNVRGMSTNDNIPDHPYAKVVGLAATRNNSSNPNMPPSTIAKASWVTSGDIPWIETAIDTGNNNNIHDPITVPFTASGSVPIPDWADFIDVIPLGGGGGGRQGSLGFGGEGGKAGKWAPTTWQRGVHYNNSTVSVEFVCGAGGVGGSGTGDAGGDSTFSIPGFSTTAGGGAGGTSLKLAAYTGGTGPGPFTYNEQVYVGGGDQKAAGAAGAPPGGGGAGGNFMNFQNGGDGAPGAGWVRFRQSPLDNEEVGDHEPPTPPTVTLDAATLSSLTVTASGSTDDTGVVGYHFYLNGVRID